MIVKIRRRIDYTITAFDVTITHGWSRMWRRKADAGLQWSERPVEEHTDITATVQLVWDPSLMDYAKTYQLPRQQPDHAEPCARAGSGAGRGLFHTPPLPLTPAVSLTAPSAL